MVLGNLSELVDYINAPELALISRFIEKTRANTVAIGEWIFLNEGLKALVLQKSGYVEGVFESHTVYKDLHIVIDGSDKLFLGDNSKASIKAAYESNGDYTLYNSEMLFSIKMKKNAFAIIQEGEIHSNRIDDLVSKKIVIKLTSKCLK